MTGSVCKMWSDVYLLHLCLLTAVFWIELCTPCGTRDGISPCLCEIVYSNSTDENKMKIDCTGNGLRLIPQSFPFDIAYLDFSNNNLDVAKLNTLCKYGYLENVSLADNHMTRFPPNELSKCYITESLNLSGNVFDSVSKESLNGLDSVRNVLGIESRHFDSDTFSKSDSLEVLSITLHQTKIPDNLFEGTVLKALSMDIKEATGTPASFLDSLADSLIDLTLSSKSLKEIDKDLVTQMKRLQTFKLYVSMVPRVPSSLFQSGSLPLTLKSITISGAKNLPRRIFTNLKSLINLKIEHADDIPSELFEGLLMLTNLDLSHCSVRQVSKGWFNDLWSLKSLNLSNTGLEIVDRMDYTYLESLVELDMSWNTIRELDDEAFVEILDTVEIIYLNNNRLKKIDNKPFKNAASLRVLDLSQNEICCIKNGAFIDLLQLRELYLKHNKLFKLHADTFLTNINLVNIDLRSNVLSAIPETLFSKTAKVKVINLSDNHIEAFGKSMTNTLPELRELNFRYNPIVCNCETAAAVRGYLGMVNLLGTCDIPAGGILIREFIPENNCKPISTSLPTVQNGVGSTLEYPVMRETISLESEFWSTDTDFNGLSVSESVVISSSSNGYMMSTDVISTQLQNSSFDANSASGVRQDIGIENKTDLMSTRLEYSSFDANATSGEGQEIDIENKDHLFIQPSFVVSSVVINEGHTEQVTTTTTSIFPNVNADNPIYQLEEILPSTSADAHSIQYDHMDSTISVNNEFSIEIGKQEDDVKTKEYYYAVAFICSVALGCILIIGYIVYRRTRSSRYEVTRGMERDDVDIDTVINDNANDAILLKDVPSIQIETMDDNGAVRVVDYPLNDESENHQ